jgi:hypothetical protein
MVFQSMLDLHPQTPETVLFSSGNVSVTPGLLRIGATSHPLSAIVSVTFTQKPSANHASFYGVMSVLCLAGCLVMLLIESSYVAAVALAGLCGALAVAARGAKPVPGICTLKVLVKGRDLEVISSRDAAAVLALRTLIEQAMARQ